MFPKVRVCLCVLAILLFLASLGLPAFSLGGILSGQASGFGCFLAAWYFYPSHMALLSAPLVASSKRKRLRRTIAGLLLLTFVVALALVLTFEEVYAGFWLWCSSFAISGVALTLPMGYAGNVSQAALLPTEKGVQ